MNFIFYILGFLPSAIWLFFYLRKDSHPESNRMILITFLFGMMAAFYALILELAFREVANLSSDNGAIQSFLRAILGNEFAIQYEQLIIKIMMVFIGGAMIEEVVKYLVVRLLIFQNAELDEPVDLMLYMIIGALGFAAVENILFLLNYPQMSEGILTPLNALIAMGCRFVSATFLHALSSAVLGYFIALSFLNIKNKKRYFLLGLLISSILHGIYNWYIMAERGELVIALLVFLGLIVGLIFKKIKNVKSVCLLKND